MANIAEKNKISPGKTMDKQDANTCKQALVQGQCMCGGGDLLTQCITQCKKFNIMATNSIKEMDGTSRQPRTKKGSVERKS